MSSGPADCAAEGEIYRAVWNAVYDLRMCFNPEYRGRWLHIYVGHVNEIIADQGYRFELAQYAAPDMSYPEIDAERLWDLSFQLRKALKWANVGHRGWGPVIDREVDGLLRGTGYELRSVR